MHRDTHSYSRETGAQHLQKMSTDIQLECKYVYEFVWWWHEVVVIQTNTLYYIQIGLLLFQLSKFGELTTYMQMYEIETKKKPLLTKELLSLHKYNNILLREEEKIVLRNDSPTALWIVLLSGNSSYRWPLTNT